MARKFLIAIILLIAWPAAIASAQGAQPQVSSTGTITGQVVDPAGAAISGATVTITNNPNKHSATTQTDSNGNFSISGFPLGAASIRVSAAGFAVAELSGVNVSGDRAPSQHIVLRNRTGASEMMAFIPNDDAGAEGGDSGGKAPNTAVGQQLSQGEQLTGSAWGTPDACATDTKGALAARGILFVHRALVLPRQATDDFGYRLGRRFIVYQVTITNAAPNFQYAVSDIVVDLKPIFQKLKVPLLVADATNSSTPAAYQASSQDLSMLRGVPEKGQDYDPRNMTLHILQGIGAVGAGISGLTPFTDVMGSAMANFNGAFLQAFTGIASDHTATQLNRLSDKAFASNTLIGKLQTKTFAIFIPEEFVMSKETQKTYWKDPRSALNDYPFDQLNVCVDGILLIQATTTPVPTFSTDEALVPPNSTVSLIPGNAGATIYYTTDGKPPTTSSTKYSSPISIGDIGTPGVTIQAFATAPDQSPSNTVAKTFSPAPISDAPTLTCTDDNKSVKIGLGNSNDVVYYTTNGTLPNRTSPSISVNAPISIPSNSKGIQAIEVGNNKAMSVRVSKSCP